MSGWRVGPRRRAGLVLDWECLPDPEKLDPAAPTHDSSSGVFAVSRFVPTLRSVCGHRFDVPIFQRLYQPTDEFQRPLTIVGEAIHESVLARFDREVLVSAVDGEELDLSGLYAPANVAALFDENGKLTPDVAVATS